MRLTPFVLQTLIAFHLQQHHRKNVIYPWFEPETAVVAYVHTSFFQLPALIKQCMDFLDTTTVVSIVAVAMGVSATSTTQISKSS